MKVLVLGYGSLGQEIVKQTGWDYISRKKDGFDITDTETWDCILKYNCDVIINCVANTDTYSNDRESHWKTNFKGVHDLINFCNEHKIKLVHISTDYVYGGNKFPNVSEKDVPVHMENWYSYTKLLGDSQIQLICENYLILRLGHKPKPFPYKYGFTDVIGNFDYTDTITTLIVKCVENDISGVYNLGTEPKTMYELATKTNEDVTSSKDFNNKLPKNVTMCLDKLKLSLSV